MIIGTALYIDVKASISTQLESAGRTSGCLKSSKLLVSLTDQNSLQWPTVKLVCSRVKEEKGEKLYQGAVLHNYNTATLNDRSSPTRRHVNLHVGIANHFIPNNIQTANA